MKYRLIKWFGFGLILIIGVIHLLMAPVEYEEAHYLGTLFGANFLGTILAAVGILRGRSWGWALGFLIAVGSIVGYILSRTVGMPGMGVEGWFSPYGVVAMIAEGIFSLFILAQPWKINNSVVQPSVPILLRFMIPASVLALASLVIISTNFWDANKLQPDHGHEVTAAELASKPITSMDDLEREYGIKVTQVGMSAMNSIVDVRVKVINPQKSYPLLDEHAALYVDQKAVVLAPHQHGIHRVKPGKILVMFFPSQNETIHAGSEVSLVLGNLIVEPILVR